MRERLDSQSHPSRKLWSHVLTFVGFIWHDNLLPRPSEGSSFHPYNRLPLDRPAHAGRNGLMTCLTHFCLGQLSAVPLTHKIVWR